MNSQPGPLWTKLPMQALVFLSFVLFCSSPSREPDNPHLSKLCLPSWGWGC